MKKIETQVLIIGGGITGTGLARDLALRGLQCVVVEKGDINSDASGANHVKIFLLPDQSWPTRTGCG